MRRPWRRPLKSSGTLCLKADRAPFEALTADQLSYGHSAGRVEDTTQVITAAMSGPSRGTFITLTDHTMQMVGDHAMVRHPVTGETEREGKTHPVKIS